MMHKDYLDYKVNEGNYDFGRSVSLRKQICDIVHQHVLFNWQVESNSLSFGKIPQ